MNQCPICWCNHPSRLHLAQCEIRAAEIEAAQQHTDQLDKPPTHHAVADLIAFLMDRRGEDIHVAARCARVVSDLGWRPVVGAA